MSIYDIYLKNEHPEFIKKIMVRFSKNLIYDFLESFSENKQKIKLLEIGPGKGYFFDACKEINFESGNRKIQYFALDRNKSILDNLGLQKNFLFESELPEIGVLAEHSFDIVYCAFVIEHLKNGEEIYNFVHDILRHVNKDGLLVFHAPNSMRLKMEFWNIDYTHNFPTTKRNLIMIFNDNGINDVEIIDIHGLLYHKYFKSKFIYSILNFALFFYNYSLSSKIFRLFYKIPVEDLSNVFYKIYAFAKEPNLLLIAKNRYDFSKEQTEPDAQLT